MCFSFKTIQTIAKCNIFTKLWKQCISLLEELTDHFNMLDFQKQLNGSSFIISQDQIQVFKFNIIPAFQSFVRTALENLQLQMQLSSKQFYAMEIQTRQKTLLLHGVPEVANEDVSECVS